MNNRPTKNFYFDDSIDFWFLNKEDFHKQMYEIETYFREKKFDDIPNKVRKIFEQILHEIIQKKDIKINSINSISMSRPTIRDKIYAIDNHCSLDYHVKMSLFRVNDFCNTGSHYNKSNEIILSFEILTLLKNFYIAIIGFLELGSQNDNFRNIASFEDIYTNINIENIISRNGIEFNKRKATQYYPDISVQEINIFNFLFKEKRKFIIPLYQRGYTWNSHNIEDLFTDILDRMKDKTSHYFGVIAGKLITNSDINIDDINAIKKIKIIDGQQRLTTSVLIVMACYYILKKLNDITINKTFDDIFKCLGSKDDFVNLFHNPASNGDANNAFKKILGGAWKEGISSNKYDSNLSYLIKKIEETFGNNCDSIKEFMNNFLNFFTIAMVDFNSWSIDIKKELEIFENLNSKGRNLTLTELIKNYIFNLCDEDTLNNKQIDVETYFSKNIVAEISRCLKSKDSEAPNKYLEQFYCYLITYFKGKEIASNESNSKNNSNSLLKDFKEYVILKVYDILSIPRETKCLTIDQYKTVIDKLSEFLVMGFIPIKLNIGDNGTFYIYDFIETLSDKKKTPLYSLSFLIAENYPSLLNLPKKDKKIIFHCYQYLITIITFYFIVVGQGDSDIKRIIVSKIANIRDELKSHKPIEEIYTLLTKKIVLKEVLKSKNISKEEMKLKISNINSNSWSAKTLLLLISYHLSKDGGDPENICKPISLEHIMPQTLNSIWIADIRKWNNEMNNYTDKQIEEHSIKYINELGNYLLVTKDLNSKLSNKPFAVKINILKNQNFIQILTQSKYLDINILQKNAWSFIDIEKRTQLLTNLAIEISCLY